MPSRSTVARIHEPPPPAIAPTAVPGNFNAETIAIDDWADRHGDGLTAMELEALTRLVFMPFECRSIEDACERTALILRALRGQLPTRRMAMDLFDEVLAATDDRSRSTVRP